MRSDGGRGCIFRRGPYWWIKYYREGKQQFESSKSDDRGVAEELLRSRLGHYSASVFKHRQARAMELLTGAQGTVGAASELLVTVDLLNLGYEVFRSVSPHASIDLIAMKRGLMVKVEVKTGVIQKNGKLANPTIRNHGHYDVLAVLGRDGRIEYTPSLESIGADGEIRTLTGLLPVAPKATASASSATSAESLSYIQGYNPSINPLQTAETND
jgi:hypothetical protein